MSSRIKKQVKLPQALWAESYVLIIRKFKKKFSIKKFSHLNFVSVFDSKIFLCAFGLSGDDIFRLLSNKNISFPDTSMVGCKFVWLLQANVILSSLVSNSNVGFKKIHMNSIKISIRCWWKLKKASSKNIQTMEQTRHANALVQRPSFSQMKCLDACFPLMNKRQSQTSSEYNSATWSSNFLFMQPRIFVFSQTKNV